jgi:L-cysteine:1D-myo-inositol 2-amino-2-deoxy-alpha-D-glucopyranoside ligase
MRAWRQPEIPSLPGRSVAPVLYDTATKALVEARPEGATIRLYVCGITPYDATHIGHAATYLAFDTVQRVWRDAGYTVHYAQNVTDVDDPLLERAAATGVQWEELAHAQVESFRTDMEALSIIPPDRLVAVTEVIDEVVAAVSRLSDAGLTYPVDTPDAVPSHDGTRAQDIYFDIAAAERATPWRLGEASGLSRAEMLPLFAERGGDPDRAGKRDPLDPLLWRAARPGEPSWPAAVGAGRPGWHIECAVIALSELGAGFTVQGGGTDLIFPHHDLSGGHATALSGHKVAAVYSHAGMVSYRGEKMSKSLGNLVLVSDLLRDGWDPRALRLALLAHHYRSDWEWTDAEADAAHRRLALWRAAFGGGARAGTTNAAETIGRMRTALAHDLDTPAALAIVDNAAGSGVDAPRALAHAIDALLGIRVVD